MNTVKRFSMKHSFISCILTVSLDGGGTQFTGFLIQAKSSNGQIVGTMIALDSNSRVLFCGGSVSTLG